MIQIYICDDEDAVRRSIQEEIQKKILIEEYDMQVVLCTANPKELLQALAGTSQKRNVYFLDVELKDAEYDGFLLGREIRRIDPNGTLCYITSYENLAYRTFQYHLEAFDYIIKSPQKQAESIRRCLESLYVRLQDETKQDIISMYSVKIGDSIRHIALQDILCFETSQKAHHVILHTCSSRMDFVGNLNEIGEQLGSAFIRTHRSYLVAADKITEIDLKHGKVKVGNMDCLVSRKMKSVLLEEIKKNDFTLRKNNSV